MPEGKGTKRRKEWHWYETTRMFKKSGELQVQKKLAIKN